MHVAFVKVNFRSFLILFKVNRARLRRHDQQAERGGPDFRWRRSWELFFGGVRDDFAQACLPLHHQLLSALGSVRGCILDLLPCPVRHHPW